jgi:hypothetical protein
VHIKKYKGTNEQGEFVQRRPRVYSHTVSAIPFFLFVSFFIIRQTREGLKKACIQGILYFTIVI